MADRDPSALARGYYAAIDDADYDRLAALLAPDFVQVRGDRTLEGRSAFVRFMRDGRPESATTHEIDAVYARECEVGVRGRRRGPEGDVWFGFVDVFTVAEDRLARLTTYTNERVV